MIFTNKIQFQLPQHYKCSGAGKDKEAMKEIFSKEIGAELKELDLCIHKLNRWSFFALYENNSKCYIEKNYQGNG